MPEPWYTLAIVGASIAAVIVLVLRFKLQPFLTLLIVALCTGLAFGADPQAVLAAVRKGTGEALGFVAVVIGLGAMLGGLLEASGGVNAIAHRLLDLFGERRMPWALTAIGIIVGIPLFFDVAFIILAPLLTTLAVRAERRVTYFALPLLAGLMAMHALLPPHPGPVAVAELIGTDYGLLALYGLICGIPAAILAGPVFAKMFHGAPGFGDQAPPPMLDEGAPQTTPIGFAPALVAMLVPLGLILIAAVAGVLGTLTGSAGQSLGAFLSAGVTLTGVVTRDGVPVADAASARFTWHDAPVDTFYTDAAQTMPFTGTIIPARNVAVDQDGRETNRLYGSATETGAPLTMTRSGRLDCMARS